jgi:hypothetical protein
MGMLASRSIGRQPLFHSQPRPERIIVMGTAGTSRTTAGGSLPTAMRPAAPADGGSATISVQAAVVFAVVAFILEAGSLVFYSAASGFSTRFSVQPILLLTAHPSAAPLIRWGSIVDLFGYVCIVPVVVYLRDRHAGVRYVNLYAVAGIALVIIGVIGAVVMSTAAPYLIDQYHAASSGGKQNIELVFTALYRAVVEGMWQTLETIPAAVWLIGTALAIRGRTSRAVVVIMLLIGLANAGIVLYRLSGL